MTWYYARVRWAVMVEGRGLRQWKESMIVFGRIFACNQSTLLAVIH